MKRIHWLFILGIVMQAACRLFVPTIEMLPQVQPDEAIVAGYGWGEVHLGARKEKLDKILGEGELLDTYSDIYFVDYLAIGLQISFSVNSNEVQAIFFYNNQKSSERFSTFAGKTSTGIDWNSTVEEVIDAYGPPIQDYHGADSGIPWRRLVFDGIDFRFEDNKMVRIAVPGR